MLRAVEHLRGISPLLALTNVTYSTLGRAADALVDLGVGPEIGVAATKTFTAQIVAGTAVLLAGLACADRLHPSDAEELSERLRLVPAQIAAAEMHARAHAADVARTLADAPGFLFVHEAQRCCTPQKEPQTEGITYRWAECQAAGELKHGPIALRALHPGHRRGHRYQSWPATSPR